MALKSKNTRYQTLDEREESGSPIVSRPSASKQITYRYFQVTAPLVNVWTVPVLKPTSEYAGNQCALCALVCCLVAVTGETNINFNMRELQADRYKKFEKIGTVERGTILRVTKVQKDHLVIDHPFNGMIRRGLEPSDQNKRGKKNSLLATGRTNPGLRLTHEDKVVELKGDSLARASERFGLSSEASLWDNSLSQYSIEGMSEGTSSANIERYVVVQKAVVRDNYSKESKRVDTLEKGTVFAVDSSTTVNNRARILGPTERYVSLKTASGKVICRKIEEGYQDMEKSKRGRSSYVKPEMPAIPEIPELEPQPYILLGNAQLRRGYTKKSSKVTVLEKGLPVLVDHVINGRAFISAPTKGWASLRKKSGAPLLQKIDKEDSELDPRKLEKIWDSKALRWTFVVPAGGDDPFHEAALVSEPKEVGRATVPSRGEGVPARDKSPKVNAAAYSAPYPGPENAGGYYDTL